MALIPETAGTASAVLSIMVSRSSGGTSSPIVAGGPVVLVVSCRVVVVVAGLVVVVSSGESGLAGFLFSLSRGCVVVVAAGGLVVDVVVVVAGGLVGDVVEDGGVSNVASMATLSMIQ